MAAAGVALAVVILPMSAFARPGVWERPSSHSLTRSIAPRYVCFAATPSMSHSDNVPRSGEPAAPAPEPDNPTEERVHLTVKPAVLDLGTVAHAGVYNSPAELKVHLSANVEQVSVLASATALTAASGGSISPERFYVRLPESGEFVPLNNAVRVFGPTGPHAAHFTLKFCTVTTGADVPGDYAGTLVLTCALPP